VLRLRGAYADTTYPLTRMDHFQGRFDDKFNIKKGK
jgi:hypothetical protein